MEPGSQRLRPSVPSKFWIRMAGMLVLRATSLPCDLGITCRVDNTRLLSFTVLVLLWCGWGIDAQQVFCAYLVDGFVMKDLAIDPNHEHGGSRGNTASIHSIPFLLLNYLVFTEDACK